MKVVFHIHDLAMWETCLANVRNFLHANDDKLSCQVEVVANGPAVKGYLDADICEGIKQIMVHSNIVFSSCHKAMTNQQIEKTDLLIDVSVVSSGVYRLVELQYQHYAYIKV